jgi:predicted HAD superfamily phosphohydrolase
MKHNYHDIEMKTFNLINQTRMNPQTFVKELSHLATTFKGNTYQLPGTNINIVTQEGRAAVDDAVKFLKVFLSHTFPIN